MNEQAQEAESTEEVETTEQTAEPTIEASAEPNTVEDIARASGWKPLKEWDGDPKEWRSAEVFNERGEWIQRHKVQQKQIDNMESTFNTRLDNANKLHQQQMEIQKADLVRKRDEAIDGADREAANSYQEDIDKINAQPIDVTPIGNNQSALDNWNKANPWIDGTEPKAAYAKQQYIHYQGQGMAIETTLANVDNDVSREFPAINHERNNQPFSEGGSKPGNKRVARKLTMADLTSEEKKYYKAMPGAWKTEAEFLQAAQDTRSES